MSYLVDRQHALSTEDVVAVLAVRQRRVRSRVILRDNSLYHTLTRPSTIARCVTRAQALIETARARRRGRT